MLAHYLVAGTRRCRHSARTPVGRDRDEPPDGYPVRVPAGRPRRNPAGREKALCGAHGRRDQLTAAREAKPSPITTDHLIAPQEASTLSEPTIWLGGRDSRRAQRACEPREAENGPLSGFACRRKGVSTSLAGSLASFGETAFACWLSSG